MLSGNGAQLLQILGEDTVSLYQDGASAIGGEGGSHGCAETVTHGGKTFVGDDPLAGLLFEGLHHDGEGAAAGAGDDNVLSIAEAGQGLREYEGA